MTKEEIIKILKKRVQNLITSDLVSPLFWEDFADELIGEEIKHGIPFNCPECGKEIQYGLSNECVKLFLNSRLLKEQPKISDGDIEKWTDTYSLVDDEDEPGSQRIDTSYWIAFVEGAKAMRDGKITKAIG